MSSDPIAVPIEILVPSNDETTLIDGVPFRTALRFRTLTRKEIEGQKTKPPHLVNVNGCANLIL